MLKMARRALIDVFGGWMNLRARDIADSMGNRSADRNSIGLVQQALGKIQGLKGPFELAAQAWRQVPTPANFSRPFRPFPSLLANLPRPEPRPQ